MIYYFEEKHFKSHAKLIENIYRLRKLQFVDKQKWDIPTYNDLEYDKYDHMSPVYLVLADPSKTKVHASLRLMPTTGPTLLFDVFRNTMPNASHLHAPEIWECTRFCVDETLEREREFLPTIPASSLLLLGLCEFGLLHNISMIAANFDPIMKRVYRASGCEVDILGISKSYGTRPVSCGTFEVSDRILGQMRRKLGIKHSVLGELQNVKKRDEYAA